MSGLFDFSDERVAAAEEYIESLEGQIEEGVAKIDSLEAALAIASGERDELRRRYQALVTIVNGISGYMAWSECSKCGYGVMDGYVCANCRHDPTDDQ